MLVISRKVNERILIGDNIVITVVKLEGNKVRLGIEAPRDIKVSRGEPKQKDVDPTECVE